MTVRVPEKRAVFSLHRYSFNGYRVGQVVGWRFIVEDGDMIVFVRFMGMRAGIEYDAGFSPDRVSRASE